jgi:hypothetical protein
MSDETSNTPLSVIAHEAGCSLNKSSDPMRVCISYNRVRNWSYL